MFIWWHCYLAHALELGYLVDQLYRVWRKTHIALASPSGDEILDKLAELLQGLDSKRNDHEITVKGNPWTCTIKLTTHVSITMLTNIVVPGDSDWPPAGFAIRALFTIPGYVTFRLSLFENSYLHTAKDISCTLDMPPPALHKIATPTRERWTFSTIDETLRHFAALIRERLE